MAFIGHLTPLPTSSCLMGVGSRLKLTDTFPISRPTPGLHLTVMLLYPRSLSLLIPVCLTICQGLLQHIQFPHHVIPLPWALYLGLNARAGRALYLTALASTLHCPGLAAVAGIMRTTSTRGERSRDG